jgi:hypothetical protein
MRARVLFICALFAVGSALVVLAGCGGGSSEGSTSTSAATPGSTTSANTSNAPPDGKNEQDRMGQSKGQKDAKAKKAENPSKAGDRAQANPKPAKKRDGSSKHRQELPGVIEDVVAAGGTSHVKRTASSPSEVREVLEEVEHQADEKQADGGSSPNPVKSIVNQIANP